MSGTSDYPTFFPPPAFAPPPTDPLATPSLQEHHKSIANLRVALVVIAVLVAAILSVWFSRSRNKQVIDDDLMVKQSQDDVKKTCASRFEVVQLAKPKNAKESLKKSRVHEKDIEHGDLESGVDEGFTSAVDEDIRHEKFEKERFAARDVEKSNVLKSEPESDSDERCSSSDEDEYYDAEEFTKSNACEEDLESGLYYKRFSKSKRKGNHKRKH